MDAERQRSRRRGMIGRFDAVTTAGQAEGHDFGGFPRFSNSYSLRGVSPVFIPPSPLRGTSPTLGEEFAE